MAAVIEIPSRRTLKIKMPVDFQERSSMLIMHYLRDESGQFEASAGHIDAEPHVVISIEEMHYPFTVAEARELAQSLQATMEKLPDAEASMMVPDLIMALRFAADRIEASDQAKAGAVN